MEHCKAKWTSFHGNTLGRFFKILGIIFLFKLRSRIKLGTRTESLEDLCHMEKQPIIA